MKVRIEFDTDTPLYEDFQVYHDGVLQLNIGEVQLNIGVPDGLPVYATKFAVVLPPEPIPPFTNIPEIIEKSKKKSKKKKK